MKSSTIGFLSLFVALLFPFAAASQWVQTNGPEGGAICCFVTAPAENGTGVTNLFTGTYGGGVYLSTDNGSKWTAVNTGLTDSRVRALAAHFTPGGTGGTYLFAGIEGGGVFLSTDNGASWTAVNTGLTNKDVHALLSCTAPGGTGGMYLFAGTFGDGVFLSTNGGASWTAVNSGLTNTRIMTFALSGTKLFAGTVEGGVFLSTNYGTSWTAVNAGLTNLVVQTFAIYPATGGSPAESGTGGTNLFAGTEGDGVFLSTNDGTTWTAVNTGLTNKVVYSLACSPTVDGSSGMNLFAGTYDGVFLSTNNGADWTAANAGLAQKEILALAVYQVPGGSPAGAGTSGTNLFAGTFDDGVFISTNNGISWTAANSGLTAYSIRAVALSPRTDGTGGNNLFAGTWEGGVFLSTNNGTSWTAVNTGLPMKRISALAVSPASGGTGGTKIFAGLYYGGGVFLSTNIGTSWTAVNTGLTTYWVNALAVSPNPGGTGGTCLFAGTSNGVFLSTNDGASWTAVNTGLTNTVIQSLAAFPATSGSGTNLFAGTVGSGVFLSTNNGATWSAANTGMTTRTILSFAQSLASDGTGTTYLFAGGNVGGVYRSTNNGTSWTTVNTGLTNVVIEALASSPATGGTPGTHLFAGTLGGVFISTNHGTNWTAVNQGLTATSIYSFGLSGTHLFAGTAGSSVWRRPLSDMTATLPPNAPALASPADGATGLATSPTLAWNALPEAVFYRLQVSSAESFSTMVYDDSTLTITSRQVSGLVHNTKYYWRVRAKNSAGSGAFSDFWSFTTIHAVLTAPTLAEPPDGATGLATSPTLAWNAAESAASYRLQVSTTPSFSTTVYDDSTLIGTSKKISGLANNTKYYWRVRAKNVAGPGAFSDVWMFKTIPLAPTVPVLVEPSDGATGTAVNPTLRWNAVEGVENYHLQISKTPSFSTTVFDDSTLTATSSEAGPLAGNTNYYWRVAAKNEAGKSPFSIIWVFTTGTSAVGRVGEIIPVEFALEQNYPNPFNSSTAIRFSIPSVGYVTLKIYDARGNETATLMAGELAVGIYEANWNAEEAASGVYFYRLQSKGHVFVKKLILMK